MDRTTRRVVIDAPSNLGLRPPMPGTVPGCYKLPWALRDRGLLARIEAVDGGAVVPPRYDRGGWEPGDGVFNAAGIAAYSRALAGRLGPRLDAGEFPVMLGGDCSILLGTVLALRRAGRYGVAYLDGHSDLRHTGNSDHVGAAGGEGLALITGRGQADLTDLDGLRPYVRDDDVAVLGIRDDDEYQAELAELDIAYRTVSGVRKDGPATTATEALRVLERPGLDGFWLHLDADILDPSIMPAVDSPDPGGLDVDEVRTLLTALLASPHYAGFEVAIFDPDLDPDGTHADLLTDLLAASF